MTSPITTILECKRIAAKTRCRMSAFKVTTNQAREICDQVAWACERTPDDLLNSMIAGEAYLLGIKIKVVDALGGSSARAN